MMSTIVEDEISLEEKEVNIVELESREGGRREEILAEKNGMTGTIFSIQHVRYLIN